MFPTWPKIARGGAKMARRGLKTFPSWPQEGLRRLQEKDFDLQSTVLVALQQCFPPTWPKMALRGPKMALRGPKRPQVAPRWPQEAPRWPQVGPKMLPRWPKMAPGGPKMAPRGSR